MEGNGGKLTDTVIGLAMVGLVGYEVWTLVNNRQGDTISESVWRAATKRPFVPFAVGVLMGHFFWQREVPEVKVEIEVEKK